MSLRVSLFNVWDVSNVGGPTLAELRAKLRKKTPHNRRGS
jgi:hypothetical protein